MLRPGFAAFVARRHIFLRLKSTGTILIGVSLGVFVMAFMQSMMGGFQSEFMRILLTTSPSILVKGRPRGEPKTGRVFAAPGAIVAPTRLRPADREKGVRNFREITRRIEALPGIRAVAPLVQGRALLRFGIRSRGANLFAVHAPDYDQVVEFRSKLLGGTADDLVARRDGVILGYFLAEELGAKVGDRVRLDGVDGRATALRVVALFKSGITVIDRTSVFVNLAVGQAMLGYPAAATGMAIKVHDHNRATELARQVEYLSGLESQSWQEINANFFGIIRQQNIITFSAVGLTMLVAGFGIANGLVTVVLDKRRDIGILRSMGVTRRGITLIFTLEGVLIGAIGITLGLLLGAWAIGVMDETLIGGRGGLSVSDTFLMLRGWDLYARTALFTILVSTLASLFPALRAARYDPVEIIRTAR